MSTSQPDPVLSVENPVSLIRSRIKEKRLFEARFLCRQLGDALGAKERLALERELTGLMDQVDTLQQQARVLLDEGQKDQVVRLYNEMEAIAIDVPGLAEEKRALEGSEAIIAKLTSKTPQPVIGNIGWRQRLSGTTMIRGNRRRRSCRHSCLGQEEQGVAVPAAGTHRRKGWVVSGWTAGLAGTPPAPVFCLARRQGKSLPRIYRPPPTTQKILIRPLVATSSECRQPAVPNNRCKRSEAGRSAHPPIEKTSPHLPPLSWEPCRLKNPNADKGRVVVRSSAQRSGRFPVFLNAK